MAISATVLDSGNDSVDASSFTTNSNSPSANAYQRLTFGVEDTDDTDEGDPSVSGNGLTWVLVRKVYTRVATGEERWRLWEYRSMGSSPSTGSITVDFGMDDKRNFQWSLIEYDGTKTTGSNGADAVVQSAENVASNETSLTVTLAAFDDSTNNWALGSFHMRSDDAVSPGTGFTERVEVNSGGEGHNLQVEDKSGEDTSVDASTTGGNHWGGIAIELAAATAAATRRYGLPLLGAG